MSLLALQREFLGSVTGTNGPPISSPAASSTPGLRVYRNNYHGQLVACLDESFVQLRRWLGDEQYRVACLDHIEAVVPRDWTLDAYPAGFVDTLERRFPADFEIADLAWLEVSLGEAFVAADAAPVTPDQLTAIDWDGAILALSPSLRMRPARSNAVAIWTALAAGTPPPAARNVGQTGEIAVWRVGFTSCLRHLTPLEAEALRLARDGASFGLLCERLVDRLGETDGPARAGQFLGQWLRDDLITGIDSSPGHDRPMPA